MPTDVLKAGVRSQYPSTVVITEAIVAQLIARQAINANAG
jgi:hypothetical protein